MLLFLFILTTYFVLVNRQISPVFLACERCGALCFLHGAAAARQISVLCAVGGSVHDAILLGRDAGNFFKYVCKIVGVAAADDVGNILY